MPFGLVFRKAVLWHDGQQHSLRNLKGTAHRETMQWDFCGSLQNGIRARVRIDGSGPSVHSISYVKTDCSSTFEVVNNSLASASLLLEGGGNPETRLQTSGGAVLEIVG
jgi:hypothetical protein